MFYLCPECGKRFKSGADTITDPAFGRCPVCHTEGRLVGESGGEIPDDANDYEDTSN